MSNRSQEQDLIDLFVESLQSQVSKDIEIKIIHNKKCRARNFADIEFISKTGILWLIEAKSNESSDAPNTVHKIFGELLKETGRENRSDFKIALLIPEGSKEYYSKAFQAIKKEKFIKFGELIPVEIVFTFGASGVDTISWEALYDYYVGQ